MEVYQNNYTPRRTQIIKFIKSQSPSSKSNHVGLGSDRSSGEGQTTITVKSRKPHSCRTRGLPN